MLGSSGFRHSFLKNVVTHNQNVKFKMLLWINVKYSISWGMNNSTLCFSPCSLHFFPKNRRKKMTFKAVPYMQKEFWYYICIKRNLLLPWLVSAIKRRGWHVWNWGQCHLGTGRQVLSVYLVVWAGSSSLFLSKIIFCDDNRSMTFPLCSGENGVYLRRFFNCLWRHHLTWAKIITFPQGDWIEQTPRYALERNQALRAFWTWKKHCYYCCFLLFSCFTNFIFGGILVVGARHRCSIPYLQMCRHG